MTTRQHGEQAWRWDPSNMQLVGQLWAMLNMDGVDFRHTAGMGDTATIAIPTADGEAVARPGDWLARTTKGEWRILRFPTQDAYDAACAALWRHRGTVERVLEVHARATIERRETVPLAELDRALSDHVDTTTENGDTQ